MTWRSFVTEAGSLEQAALLVGYAVLVASLIMAVLFQMAWLVAKRIRPRREVEREGKERKRYLDACVGLTEGHRWR